MPSHEGCRLPLRHGAHPVASWLDLNVDDLLPSLRGHYPTSSLLRISAPLAGASVLSASRFLRLYLFPLHHQTGSQVPQESPNESHASSTPDATWPVSRLSARLFPEQSEGSGFDVINDGLRCFSQRFACARLSHSYMTRSKPRLLTMTFTTAAFDRSSSWQFEASSYTETPRGHPSSLLQHDARASS